jgi:hypothetical protein
MGKSNERRSVETLGRCSARLCCSYYAPLAYVGELLHAPRRILTHMAPSGCLDKPTPYHMGQLLADRTGLLADNMLSKKTLLFSEPSEGR